MSKYETNREKLSDYFFKNIYPKIDNTEIDHKGIDYKKTIYSLMEALKLPKGIVEAFISELIEYGRLKEIRVLEAPEEKN